MTTKPGITATTGWTGSDEELHRLLQAWHERGLLDDYEMARIEAAEHHAESRAELPAELPAEPRGAAAPPARTHRPAIGLGEALGYAGAALIVGASVVLVSQLWGDLATSGRVSLLAVASVLLLGVGLAVPERRNASARRLQAVLWTGSVALAVGAWTVGLTDGADLSTEDALVVAFVFGTLEAGLLWWRTPSALMHLATLAALAGAVGNVFGQLTFLGDQTLSMGLWALGIVWTLLALGDVVRPRQVGLPAGTVLVTIGALGMSTAHWGAVVGLASMAALLALAVWQNSLALLGVATVGTLIGVPIATGKLIGGATGMALGLLVAGAVLVLTAMRIVRHGWVKPHSAHRAPR